jgi:hypothetical protein
VQGQYRPVRAGVSCAVVRSRVAKDASRHGRGLAFGLGCTRIVTLAFYQGAWVQGQYRPVRAGVSCAAVRSRVAKHASRHGRGLAFGLYVNRDAGILSGGVGARPVPDCTCRRLLCGGASWAARAKHASRQGRGLAFGLYLNRDAGILSGGVVQVPACTCRRLLCVSAFWGC